jgi:hypothetical protein
MKKTVVFLFAVFLLFPFIPTPAHALELQDIRDAVLGKNKSVTQEMDVNKDSKVDVADLVYCLKIGNCAPVPDQKRYVGTMSFDQKFALAPQSVEVTIDETASQASFSTENSPFFPSSFKMNGSFSGNMIQFDTQGTGVFKNGDSRNPLHNDISWTLNITDVMPVTVQDSDETMFQAKFTMGYTGLKPENKSLDVTGTLYLKGQVAGEGLSFEHADDMELLAQKYPVK